LSEPDDVKGSHALWDGGVVFHEKLLLNEKLKIENAGLRSSICDFQRL